MVGDGVVDRNAAAVMIIPLVQYPHWAACSAMNAAWTLCGVSLAESPSIVVMAWPAARLIGVVHDRTA